MSVAIVVAIILAFAFGRDWIVAKTSGWHRLSRKYRCRTPFKGRYRACWWAQFTTPGSKRKIVVNVGRLTWWPLRPEFPPYWVGADSGGLYLKRNAWNLLHPALLIQWTNIQSANEVTYKDLVRNSVSAVDLARGPRELHPFMAAAQGISGPLLELKISEPDISIVAQLVAFDQALPFLQSKMKPTKSQELKQGSAAVKVDY